MRFNPVVFRIAASLVLTAAASLQAFAARGLTHYETQEGVVVSRIKSISIELLPAGSSQPVPSDPDAVASPLPDTLANISLSTGRTVSLLLPGGLTRCEVHRSSRKGPVDSATASTVGIADYLPTAKVFGYEPALNSVFLAREKDGRLEVVDFRADRVGDDRFLLRSPDSQQHQDAGRSLFEILADAAALPSETAAPDEDSRKQEVFAKARNRPRRDSIQAWMTPWKVTANFTPKIENGTLYSGVLKSVSAERVVVTTWDGDFALRLRRNDRSGTKPTQFRLEDSPNGSNVIKELSLRELTAQAPGQFVSVYANGTTLEAEYVAIYKDGDP